MEQLRQFFNQLIPYSDEEWNAFASCLKREVVPKKKELIKEGQVCNYVAFIEKGAFRFYVVKEGNELVTAFFFTGDFVSNYRSYLTGAPSEHYVQALEDSVIWKITKPDMEGLFEQYPVIERTSRFMTERVFLAVTSRLDSFLYDTPEERYLKLLQRNSTLLQDVPQYMLASYLGISPESLSRIRRRITLN